MSHKLQNPMFDMKKRRKTEKVKFWKINFSKKVQVRIKLNFSTKYAELYEADETKKLYQCFNIKTEILKFRTFRGGKRHPYCIRTHIQYGQKLTGIE